MSNLNSNRTDTEVVPYGMETEYSGLGIDGGGSKQATTSDESEQQIKEEDSIESSSGNYSCLAISSGISKKEQVWDKTRVVS